MCNIDSAGKREQSFGIGVFRVSNSERSVEFFIRSRFWLQICDLLSSTGADVALLKKLIDIEIFWAINFGHPICDFSQFGQFDLPSYEILIFNAKIEIESKIESDSRTERPQKYLMPVLCSILRAQSILLIWKMISGFWSPNTDLIRNLIGFSESVTQYCH